MSTDKKSSQPNPSTENQFIIIGTFLDTTWRMFVPILVTTLIGYGLDKLYETRPTGVLLGVAAGVILSVALIYQQYKKVKHGS